MWKQWTASQISQQCLLEVNVAKKEITIVNNRYQKKEEDRVNFEMSIPDMKDRRQATKDYGRQRRMAVERIRRIQEENEIVILQKLNEYHKWKFKEEKAMEELRTTMRSLDS